MGPLTYILGIVGALAIHLLASELYENSASIAKRTIKLAARKLPSPLRNRYEEEWLGHMAQCAGNFGKLWHAVGCFICAYKLAQFENGQQIPEGKFAFDVGGNKFEVSVSTAVAFLKILRSFLKKEAIVGAGDFDKIINDYEKRLVLGPPDRDELRKLGEAMMDVSKKTTISIVLEELESNRDADTR